MVTKQETRIKTDRDKHILIFWIVGLLLLIIYNLDSDITSRVVYRSPVNLDVEISKESKTVNAGEVVNAAIIFYNLYEPKDYTINYSIKKIGSDDVLTSKEEQLLIEGEMLVERSLAVPKTAETGFYLFRVDFVGNKTLGASDVFNIRGESKFWKNFLLKFAIVVVIVVSVILTTILILTRGKIFNEMSESKKVKIKLFFWVIGWRLKQHEYYIKYLLLALILALAGIIVVLVFL